MYICCLREELRPNLRVEVYPKNFVKLTPGDAKLATSVTLPLAERMISVFEKSDKMKLEQETRLYLIVLELQVGKHSRYIELGRA
jgi:hypothetical protein